MTNLFESLNIQQPMEWPAPRDLHIWWLPTCDLEETLVERLGLILSPQEQHKADCFRYSRDRRAYVASRGALRLLLSSYLATQSPDRLYIERAPCRRCRGPHGKPMVSTDPRLPFSVAHTSALTLFGFSRSEVGVDVEFLATQTDESAIASQFTPLERQAWLALPAWQRLPTALQCWVRKEAYLKGTGDGLSVEPSLVHVGLTTELQTDPFLLPTGWKLIDVPAPSGYVAAAAVECEVLPRLIFRTLVGKIGA